jgi:Immunity protein 7
MIDALQWPTAAATLRDFNGAHVLNLNGLVNRRRYKANDLDTLLEHIGKRFPGSYRLIYDRSDIDPTFPASPNASRVRVINRGQLTTNQDPFLSPIQPAIED